MYHIRIIAPQKNGSHDMKQTDFSIIIVRNVCVLASASMIIPPLPEEGGGILFYLCPSVRPSVCPTYFSQQLLMTEI
jgi:hypothetical protein